MIIIHKQSKQYLKMLRILTLTAVFVLLVNEIIAQKIISRESNGNSYFYTDIQTAIDASVNGDVLYLPGGSFSGDIIIDKGISIIGAGHVPDSTIATHSTKIIGNVYIIEGADNGVLSGVFIHYGLRFGYENINAESNVNNYSINRVNMREYCNLSDLGVFGAGFPVNIQFSECIFQDEVLLWLAENVSFNNCLFFDELRGVVDGNESAGENGLYFNNCIFLANNGIHNLDTQHAINGAEIKSCIIKNHQSTSSHTFHFYNNVFLTTPTFGITDTHFNNTITSNQVIVSNPLPTSFSYGDDYHLVSGSPAIGAGLNGDDCGIYGGSNPYKEGAVPINPHIQTQIINANTNAQGQLPVNIKVSAQDR